MTKTKITSVIAVILVLMVLSLQEIFIREHFANGGFFIEIDKYKISDLFEKIVTSNDIIILGSSRAKEAVIPDYLEKKYIGLTAYNAAAHSGTSLDQVNNIVSLINKGSISRPKKLLITIEPLHFNRKYLLYKKEINGSSEAAVFLLDNPKEYIDRILNNINNSVSNYLYKYLKSASPDNRRKLPLWIKFIMQPLVFYNPEGVFNSYRDAYYLFLVSKGYPFVTHVVAQSHGFEGHSLYFTSKIYSRMDAFNSHINNYYNDLFFSNISYEFLEDFKYNLSILKEKNIQIVLIRLPIYKTLYNRENNHISNFNEKILELSQSLSIPYLDLNLSNNWITECLDCFTDASHMEYAITTQFNRVLIDALKKLNF